MSTTAENKGFKYYMKGLRALSVGFWSIRKRPKICFTLLVILAMSAGSVYINVLINDWYNDFYDMLQSYNIHLFWSLVGKFCMYAFIYIIMGVYQVYLQQLIQIEWRSWMTDKYLVNWLGDKSYYKLKLSNQDLDNPDQRISADIDQFINTTLNLAFNLFNQVLTLGAFVVVLWHLSGVVHLPIGKSEISIYGYMVWLSLIYSIIGTYLTNIVGRKLIKLNYEQQCYEADFRFSMMRMRENSESIAFYRGEEPELQGFRNKFLYVIKNFRHIMLRQKILNGFTVGYGQLAIILPMLFIYPKWVFEHAQVGLIMQVVNAFGQVQGAMSYFVNAYTDIATWCAVVQRLIGFHKNIESSKLVESEVDFVDGKDIAVKDMDIFLPTGVTLLHKFNLSLKNIDSLLIIGRSGVGKSTILKTLAGIWPYAKGEIVMPIEKDVLFLPQRPYLPLGTLRDSIFYPQLSTREYDDEINSLLEKCHLERLVGELDNSRDWSRILSLGEQQRLGFMRALLYKPKYVFLDESTSAMDEMTEQFMYDLLRKTLPDATIVSVGHRSSLLSKHSYKLAIGNNEQWVVEKI